jgi:ribonuclease HII
MKRARRERGGRSPWLVAGVDEAGRGPLAGPVVAADVILDDSRPIDGLADSKALPEARREALAPVIRERALAWGIGMAAADEIDTLNILRATLLAMQRALAALEVEPGHVRVDGNRCPSLVEIGLACTAEAVVGGDATVAEISAASILAKTSRDAWMRQAAQDYPGYGFERHKGYPTALHLQALARLGPCPLHRRSFAPVKSLELFPSQTPGP